MNTKNYCKVKLLLISVILVSSFLCLPTVCSASADPFLDGKIKVVEHKILSWERNGQLVGLLIFLVFFIGLAVTALQAATTRAVKIVAAVLSFLSAATVGFYHQVFPADDRTYGKAARQARSKLNAFVYELEQYPTLDKPTEIALHKKFADLLADIEQIENTTIYAADVATASKHDIGAILLPSLQAEPTPTPTAGAVRPPAWAEKVPEDDKNFYFVGNATGNTFEEARQNALKNAQQAADAKFATNAKTSPSLTAKPTFVDEVAKALAAATEAAETFVAPDPAAGGYRAYALLRLPRTAARFTAESIFVQKSVPYDKAFLDRLQKEAKQ
jgi:hypothetical protein